MHLSLRPLLPVCEQAPSSIWVQQRVRVCGLHIIGHICWATQRTMKHPVHPSFATSYLFGEIGVIVGLAGHAAEVEAFPVA